MEIKFTAIEERYKPTKADNLSAGWDLKARLETRTMTLKAHTTAVVKSGLKIQIPEGYEAQVRGRSGLWFKHGITIGHTGTIDAGYLGEIGIKLSNESDSDYVITDGERVAQMVICKLPDVQLQEVTAEEFSQFTSERGEGGFGHSGK